LNGPLVGGETHYARYARLSGMLDNAFRVPGTRFRFGFDALVAVLRERRSVVSEHVVRVPRDEAMRNLVSLVPALLQVRHAFVD